MLNEKEGFPLKEFGFVTDRENFEILFTEDHVLVIRSTNLQLGTIKYFSGEFKKNGVYEYIEKESKGIPLINRSIKYLRLRVWKSLESGKLTIELKRKSSAQIFLFLANRTKKIITGKYAEVKAANSK